MGERAKCYWLYRIDKWNIPFFWSELQQGRLRQGWGWSNKEDLRRTPRDYSTGNRLNYPIFDSVKKGDILLVPRLPNWSQVAIVEAVEDFNTGYIFEHSKEKPGDFGHIFPGKFKKSFVRANKLVSGELRKALRYPRRFKNIYYDRHESEIDKIISAEQESLEINQSVSDRNAGIINTIFNKNVVEHISSDIQKEFNKQYNATDWEYALVEGLQKLFPYYHVERKGGVAEAQHGTDILITMPGIIADYSYAIAIQVKDYDAVVGDAPLKQLSKAEKYWNNLENIKLIDKILVITNAHEEHNATLQEKAKQAAGGKIQIIFANDLKTLLYSIAISYLGDLNI